MADQPTPSGAPSCACKSSRTLFLSLLLVVVGFAGAWFWRHPLTPSSTEPQTASVPKPKTGEVATVQKLVLATTTSTQDSGLLDFLLPKFNEEFHVDTQVISVGTGQALEYGKRGDADVLLVHAKAKEEAFVKDGLGLSRLDVMYNRFIVVGPKADPAGIRGKKDAIEALKAVAGAQAPFCSRGDNSGTHTKELDLWKKAGVTTADPWYFSLGQGMGETLITANQKKAYCLADEGTWWAMVEKLGDLEVLVQDDLALRNEYGVIVVNPKNGPHVRSEVAQQFADWIAGKEGQALIGQFQKNGHRLFVPNAAH